jgi:hypothetical protein
VEVFSVAEGNLKAKFPKMWTDRKVEVGRVREEKRRKNIREGTRSEEGRCRRAKR